MDYFNKVLKDFFDKEESFLVDNYPGLNFDRLHQEFEIYNGGITDFIREVKTAKPLQYISQKSYFYKSEFYVDENVLIPRSETEHLVEQVVQKIKRPMRMADVGTGSGCIPISIALDSKFPLEIVATDISGNALSVAKINGFRHRVKMDLIKTDRLKGVEGKFDVITSNPPYIREKSDRLLVHDQVHEYEPHVALYLKDDLYEEWFSELFRMVADSLNPSGFFIMEGHENHLNDLAPLAELVGFKDVKILPDLAGSHRFLHCIKLEV